MKIYVINKFEMINKVSIFRMEIHCKKIPGISVDEFESNWFRIIFLIIIKCTYKKNKNLG